MTQPINEQIALWADKLRDIAAAGLIYAPTIYDHERYQAIQSLAIDMLAAATGQERAALEPLRDTVFARMCPVVAGTAAVIDHSGKILLMRRADNRRWVLPGGMLEVGETPAEGVLREVLEETGVACLPVALVGVYDSRRWDSGTAQQIYKFTFLCRPDESRPPVWPPTFAIETLEIGWFAEQSLPDGLYEGHRQRLHDAFRVWRGDMRPYFDQ